MIRTAAAKNFCKRFASALAMLFLSCFPAKADRHTHVQILAVHYPPFEMKTAIDGLRGHDHELVVEAFKRRGVTAEIVYVPWARAVSDAANGRVPMLLSCAITGERQEKFVFSKSISQDGYGLFSHKSSSTDEIETLSDATGYRVASIPGYVSLTKLVEMGMDPVEVPSETHALKMLQLGRIDFFYGGEQTTGFFISQLGLAGEFNFIGTESWDYHLCFSKAHPDAEYYRDLFASAFDELVADGTYERIHARYR
ncbi:transporter substrate-binding domain-containing protein [Roseibium denhamense]|uniref:Amino acid ABC transporter substrate-binding protein, PAAT family n=2 Tax=Roseibium denhamense TaxID=76305 RepID=A0ABY1PER7_9HYPH|nr:amino acid ABC transporter substrate-binding protein, PAAT family [Roseibium denhamense]